MDRQLQASEERYRAVVERANDAIFSVDSVGRVADWNRKAAAVFGYSREEVMGKPVTALMPMGLRPAHSDYFEELAAEAKSGRDAVEGQGIRKDGSEFPVEYSLATVEREDGFHYTVVLRDITEQKQPEEALRESEARFRALVDGSPTGIAMARNGLIVDSNSVGVRMFGFGDIAELRGRPYLELIAPDCHNFVVQVGRRRERGELAPTSYETVGLRKGGSRFPLLIQATWLTLPDGPATVVFLADLTEHKQLEEQRERARRLEAIGHLAGQVAHDFNNLLGPMVAYPELIKRQLPASHPAIPLCDTMLEAARLMAGISTDMLVLSRGWPRQQRPENLNALVREVASQQADAPSTLALRLDLAPDLPPINGSAEQLRRALGNLVSNAREAMRDVGVLTVRTEGVRLDEPLIGYNRVEPGEYGRLTVSDTGRGIPPEIRDRIFDAFVTTKAVPGGHGAGLGLAVVQAVVQDHEGFIDLECEVGVGTTVSIYLPIHRRPIKGVGDAEPSGGTETVPAIDDGS